jgi:hypothetical protein
MACPCSTCKHLDSICEVWFPHCARHFFIMLSAFLSCSTLPYHDRCFLIMLGASLSCSALPHCAQHFLIMLGTPSCPAGATAAGCCRPLGSWCGTLSCSTVEARVSSAAHCKVGLSSERAAPCECRPVLSTVGAVSAVRTVLPPVSAVQCCPLWVL